MMKDYQVVALIAAYFKAPHKTSREAVSDAIEMLCAAGDKAELQQKLQELSELCYDIDRSQIKEIVVKAQSLVARL